jgi:hypothetical protein
MKYNVSQWGLEPTEERSLHEEVFCLLVDSLLFAEDLRESFGVIDVEVGCLNMRRSVPHCDL